MVLHNILLLPTAVRSLPVFPVSAPACSLGHLHSRMYVQHKCTAPAYHLYPLYCCLIIYSLFQNYKRTGQGYAKLVQFTSFYFPFSLTHTRAHAHRSKTLFMSHHGLHHPSHQPHHTTDKPHTRVTTQDDYRVKVVFNGICHS